MLTSSCFSFSFSLNFNSRFSKYWQCSNCRSSRTFLTAAWCSASRLFRDTGKQCSSTCITTHNTSSQAATLDSTSPCGGHSTLEGDCLLCSMWGVTAYWWHITPQAGPEQQSWAIASGIRPDLISAKLSSHPENRQRHCSNMQTAPPDHKGHYRTALNNQKQAIPCHCFRSDSVTKHVKDISETKVRKVQGFWKAFSPQGTPSLSLIVSPAPSYLGGKAQGEL